MSEWGSSHNYNKTQQPIEFFDASQYSQNQGHEHNAVGWDSHAPLHQGGYASNDMYGKIENK